MPMAALAGNCQLLVAYGMSGRNLSLNGRRMMKTFFKYSGWPRSNCSS